MMSVSELTASLSLLENVALAFQNITGHLNHLIKEGTLTNAESAVQLQKLAKGFSEADEATYLVEKEIDERLKSNFGLMYGTRTLSSIQKEIDQMVEDRKKEAEKKEGKKAKMDLT